MLEKVIKAKKHRTFFYKKHLSFLYILKIIIIGLVASLITLIILFFYGY